MVRRIEEPDTWPGHGGWYAYKAEECLAAFHDPPKFIALEPGLYEHACVACGMLTVFRVSQAIIGRQVGKPDRRATPRDDLLPGRRTSDMRKRVITTPPREFQTGCPKCGLGERRFDLTPPSPYYCRCHD